jgi:hypothetical protein
LAVFGVVFRAVRDTGISGGITGGGDWGDGSEFFEEVNIVIFFD